MVFALFTPTTICKSITSRMLSLASASGGLLLVRAPARMERSACFSASRKITLPKRPLGFAIKKRAKVAR